MPSEAVYSQLTLVLVYRPVIRVYRKLLNGEQLLYLDTTLAENVL